MASIAFFETMDQALARPAEEWRERAERNASASDSAGFVAVLGDELVGTVGVLVRRADEPDYLQRVPIVDTATLVGVYVSPSVRGLGIVDALIEAAADWSRDSGYLELTLDVHERNVVAIATYVRAGFEFVDELVGEDGRELAMARRL